VRIAERYFPGAAAVFALVALLSKPVYEATTWRGALPSSLREAVRNASTDTSVIGRYPGIEVQYALHPARDRLVRMSLVSNSFDPALVLYRVVRTSPGLDMIAQDDDGGGNLNAFLSACLLGGEVYVVGVRNVAVRRGSPGADDFTLRLTSEATDCREEAYLNQMRADLRNLVTAEEAYRADNGRYASDIGLLHYVSVGPVQIAMGDASVTGWSATARSAAIRRACGIFVGSARPPIPGASEGEPRCWER
jgi:hypothetical protein